MTPRRWQIVGGLAVGMLAIFIVAAGWPTDFHDPIGWVREVGAGVVGNLGGQYLVKTWQDAGRNNLT